MGNSGSHDFSVITNYQLFEYIERTLYNNIPDTTVYCQIVNT